VYGFKHGCEILADVIIPETDHTIAVGGDLRTTSIIRGRLVRMLASVDLDHEFPRRAGEVGNSVADRMLATEFEERKAFAQRPPEDSFDIG
jgi:hypothetical protein